MILGLPWSSWLLLFVSVGLGLAINLTVYFRTRREEAAGQTPDPGLSPDV